MYVLQQNIQKILKLLEHCFMSKWFWIVKCQKRSMQGNQKNEFVQAWQGIPVGHWFECRKIPTKNRLPPLWVSQNVQSNDDGLCKSHDNWSVLFIYPSSVYLAMQYNLHCQHKHLFTSMIPFLIVLNDQFKIFTLFSFI